MSLNTRAAKRKIEETNAEGHIDGKKIRAEESAELESNPASEKAKSKTPKKPGRRQAARKTPKKAPPTPPPNVAQTAEAPRTLENLGCEDAIPLLRDAIDAEDYKNRLHYFWGRVFLSARDFTPGERQSIFEATLPPSVPPSARESFSGSFDSCYIDFVQFFMGKVAAYASLFLKSKAGVHWIERREHAERQKKPKTHPVPPPPARYMDMFTFMDHPGLIWGLQQAVDFWSKCLPAVDTDPAPPGQIGWMRGGTDHSGDAPSLYDYFTGISLELVRRYAVFEAAHPGGYSEDARRHDLRAVMSFAEGEVGHKFPTKNLPARPAAPQSLEQVAESEAGEFPSSPDYHAPSVASLEILQENLRKLESGKTPDNDDNEAEMTVLRSDADEMRASMQEEFQHNLEQKIAFASSNNGYSDPVGLPLPTEFFSPSLADPVITSGPYWTRRAEIYASADIWQRQLMARRDNELHRMRLDALVDTALTGIEALEAERDSQLDQIRELEKRDQRLAKAYADQEVAQGELDLAKRELDDKTRGMSASSRAGGMLSFKSRRSQGPGLGSANPVAQRSASMQPRPSTSGSMRNFEEIDCSRSPGWPDTVSPGMTNQFSAINTPTKIGHRAKGSTFIPFGQAAPAPIPARAANLGEKHVEGGEAAPLFKSGGNDQE